MSSIVFRGRDRERAILLIAGSIEDYGSFVFDPKGALRGKSTSGLGGAKRVNCRICVVGVKDPQKGLVVDKFGRTAPCPACTKPGKVRGTGKVDADSVRDSEGEEHTIVVQTVDTMAKPTRPPKTKKCQHCKGVGELPNGWFCPECKATGRIPDLKAFVLADDSREELDPLDAYTAAIKRRDSSGSYREFQVLEAELRARSPHLLTPFREVHVTVPRRDLGSLTGREREFVVRARDWFLEWMPLEVVVPRWVVVADEAARAQVSVRGKHVGVSQREARNRTWKARHCAGETTQEIADSEGVDRRTVERGIAA
jgi:hypothetical protein